MDAVQPHRVFYQMGVVPPVRPIFVNDRFVFSLLIVGTQAVARLLPLVGVLTELQMGDCLMLSFV
jgi:hypothetical protein